MSKRPKYFYVVGQLAEFAPALVRGYFEGLTGVSDTPEILNEFLWLRGTALAMPAEALLDINESPLVCQIDYDDPDALAANNLQVFGRLFNNEGDIQQSLVKLRDKLGNALELQEIERGFNKRDYDQSVETLMPGNLKYKMDYGGLPSYQIKRGLESGELAPIESAEDLARLFWDEIFAVSWGGKTQSAREIVEEMRDSKQPGRRNDMDEYDFEDFLEAVKRALIIGAAYYSDEGEWLIQQPRVYIPEGSVLIFQEPDPRDDGSVWLYENDRDREWARERFETLESHGINPGERYDIYEIVEALGLGEAYDVRWTKREGTLEKKQRRAPLLHDRLESARTRALNPKPSLDSEFWGDQGSGAYIQAEDTGRVLLLLRSAYVNEPSTWGIPGGAIDPKESPAGAARREIQEEIGAPVSSELYPLPAFSKGSFIYHNHLAVVPEEFEPTLNWESADYGWFEYEDLDHLLLHPGVVWARDNGVLDEVFEDYDGYAGY
jgi:8-oxo-dGTP pyrophosphatase MutT (NUDIX family)